ncbi:MAG: 50S ribosomal protein L5 [Candidatus Nanoarchaeia archaeon]|nr:50S ribosomal protein L5 [Candidatus Nanoarchaeia archaeon]
MNEIRIEKVTLNVGAGNDSKKLNAGYKLLESLTGKKPVKTKSKVRIAAWNVRLGLPIGVKVTLRKEEAEKFLKRAFYSKDNVISKKFFDKLGNFSFGIPEYIEIEDAKYDPELGMMGLEVAVSLEKKGYRIKRRKYDQRQIPEKKKITAQEGIEFIRNKFGVKFKEEQEDD